MPLPKMRRTGDLYEALEARRTARLFDPAQNLSREDLAALLFYTFAFRGSLSVGDHVMMLARTSPSGGGLHPIEAYPLVLRADGSTRASTTTTGATTRWSRSAG